MYPRVKSVKPNDDYTVVIKFQNGKKKMFDLKPYLGLGVFQELKNLQYFKKVKPFMGTIIWPNGQDICPDTLYLESKTI